MKEDIPGLRQGNSSKVAAVITHEDRVYIIAHELDKGTVGNLHIAEDDELVEFIGKKGVVCGIALLDQKMSSLLYNLCSLGSDVYDHKLPPVFVHS